MTGNVSVYIDRTEVKSKENVLQGNEEEEENLHSCNKVTLKP